MNRQVMLCWALLTLAGCGANSTDTEVEGTSDSQSMSSEDYLDTLLGAMQEVSQGMENIQSAARSKDAEGVTSAAAQLEETQTRVSKLPDAGVDAELLEVKPLMVAQIDSLRKNASDLAAAIRSGDDEGQREFRSRSLKNLDEHDAIIAKLHFYTKE